MDKDYIYNWFYLHLDDTYYRNLNFTIEFIKQNINIEFNENNEPIIDTNIDLYFGELDESIYELPYKFNIVNGNFNIRSSNLNSFKNFPNYINGNLNCQDSKFNKTNEWEIKKVDGYISLVGKCCKLENLSFLENTKFNNFYLKIFDSVFENNKSIFQQPIYKDIKLLDNIDRLVMSDIHQIISLELKDKEKDFDDYINLFEYELNNKGNK